MFRLRRRRPAKPIRLTTPDQILEAVRLEVLAPAEARDLLDFMAPPQSRQQTKQVAPSQPVQPSADRAVTDGSIRKTPEGPVPLNGSTAAGPKEDDAQSFFDELTTEFLASPFGATGQGRYEALATLRGWLTVARIDNLDDFYDAGGEVWNARLKAASSRMKPGRLRNVTRTAEAFVEWLNDMNGHTGPEPEEQEVDVPASADGQSVELPADPRRRPHRGPGRGRLLLPENNGGSLPAAIEAELLKMRRRSR